MGYYGSEPPCSSDNFCKPPKDLSYVTLYFDKNGDCGDDGVLDAKSDLLVVKIDNLPDAANDDLDTWYQKVIEYLKSEKGLDCEADLLGANLKYGSEKSGGGSFFYALDGDACDTDQYCDVGLEEEARGKCIDLTVNYSTLTDGGWIC